jgi:hypothetical protein
MHCVGRKRVIFECQTWWYLKKQLHFTASTGFSNMNNYGSLGRRLKLLMNCLLFAASIFRVDVLDCPDHEGSKSLRTFHY